MGQMTRRRLLATLAALPAGMVPMALRVEAQASGLITGNVCLVQPEAAEGPFYVDPGLVRSDITEDREGVPLRLRLQVVTAECQPIASARVDIWQCDAQGIYSGVRSELADARGTAFLRGTQMTDARGVATFQSIYPGWYPGRTPHIHYKVFLADRTVLTSQLFFPDSVSRKIYQASRAYKEEVPSSLNAGDRIARRAGKAAIAAIEGTTQQLDADLVVGLA